MHLLSKRERWSNGCFEFLACWTWSYRVVTRFLNNRKVTGVLHERNFCNSNALNLLSRGHSFPGTCMITDQDFSVNITTFVRQEWGMEIYIHPLKNSLRSSPFLSFFRRRRDRTSERKAGERRSTPAWGEQKNWGEVGRWWASPPPPPTAYFATLSQFPSRSWAFGKGKETAATQANSKKLARLQTDPLAKSVNEIHLTLRNRWERLLFAKLSRDK